MSNPIIIRKKWRERLNRKIAIMLVPHSQWKPWRIECSAAFLAFAVLLWSGITIWAGFVSGRHMDYWITKADNKVMRSQISRLSREMNDSWRILAQAKSTDARMRSLLGMSATDDEGVGGPTAQDQAQLRRMLWGESSAAAGQAAWHKQIEAIKQESARRLASFQEIAWNISNKKSLAAATPQMWPTEGQITSLFGYRINPMRSGDEESMSEFHPGIDIANKPDTLIYATADGTVRYAGWSHGYGQMIIIDHGYGISTVYGHNSKLLVKTGDHVWRGQVISYMGTTGRSTGAHLHYEIRQNGAPINPMKFLKVRAHSGFPSLLSAAQDDATSKELQ
ncbi:MAG: M23 family metallopeptidase [Elusimicrobiota bacterium]